MTKRITTMTTAQSLTASPCKPVGSPTPEKRFFTEPMEQNVYAIHRAQAALKPNAHAFTVSTRFMDTPEKTARAHPPAMQAAMLVLAWGKLNATRETTPQQTPNAAMESRVSRPSSPGFAGI